MCQGLQLENDFSSESPAVEIFKLKVGGNVGDFFRPCVMGPSTWWLLVSFFFFFFGT